MNKFIEIKASNKSIAKRKLVFGFGVNDADYIVNLRRRGKSSRCNIYTKWHEMLKRCYCDKYQYKNPTYIGCYVCDDWLIFSNFKRWVEKQSWGGKDLDKDIINPGNKVYSPKTCCLISRWLNTMLLSCAASRGEFPQGVSWNGPAKKFESKVSYKGKRINLGLFTTKEQASNAYKKAKSKIILNEAESQCDKRISNGLRLHAEILLKS